MIFGKILGVAALSAGMIGGAGREPGADCDQRGRSSAGVSLWLFRLCSV